MSDANPLPIQKYMLHNLSANSEETRERLTYRGMRNVIKRTLDEIGFSLQKAHVNVDSFGRMSDAESAIDSRFWATFSVDLSTAREIFNQRKGRNKQILRINESKRGSFHSQKYLKLKQYKGVKYEAIRMTLDRVAKILSSDKYRKEDGFVIKIEKKKIIIGYQKGPNETLKLVDLINDAAYRGAFEEAVKSLPDTFQQVMLKLRNGLRIQKPLPTSPPEAPRRAAHYPMTPPTIGPYLFSSSPSANISS